MMKWINPGFTAIFVMLVLISCPVSLLAGNVDDCAEAKTLYQQGVNLLHDDERLAAFQKAVDLCPDYAEAHNNLADAYENLGRRKKRTFSEQTQIDGDRNLGKAEYHYKKALELKPDMIAPRLGLAIVNIYQGRYPVAIRYYEEVLQRKPGFPHLQERIKLLKTLDSSVDRKDVREALKIISEIGQTTDYMDDFSTMGIKDEVVRDIKSRPRQSFNNILFPPWSSVIEQGNPTKQVNEIGQALASPELKSLKFIIEGHANNVGSSDRNITLSNDRAKAVREYLIKNYGVAPDRIITQGFGFTKPKYIPDTDIRNRRVEIIFFNEMKTE